MPIVWFFNGSKVYILYFDLLDKENKDNTGLNWNGHFYIFKILASSPWLLGNPQLI